MKLIDKDALVAELNRKKIPFKRDVEDGNYPTYLCAIMDFEDFIDTLEVKEVDLDKEVDDVMKIFLGNITCREEQLNFAKHFFELALSLKNS